MKKRAIMALSMVMILLFVSIGFAETKDMMVEGDFVYRVVDGGAEIVNCSSDLSRRVVIPSELGGYPVISIGSEAVSWRSNITHIVIPDSVKRISTMAFSYCNNLKITIGKNVSKIEESAFHSSYINEFIVDEENASYCSVDSVLFDKDKKTLILYPNGRKDKSYIIPDGTSMIGNRAFFLACNLENILFPDGLTKIGEYAFFECNELSKVSIPDSVTEIGQHSFAGCYNLKTIDLPENLKEIPSRLFYNCENLTSVSISESISKISFGAFDECRKLKEINIDKNNAVYDSEDGVVFTKDKSTLICYPAGKETKEYTIPYGVKEIEKSAFSSQNYLESITIPSSVVVIKEDAFYRCEKLASIYLEEGIEEIGDNAFALCEKLEEIKLPNGLERIGYGVFYSCNNIVEIHIPGTVIDLEDAFSNSDGLIEITVDEKNENYCSVDGVLFSKDKTKLIRYPVRREDSIYTIPEGVQVISELAFSSGEYLTSVTIPDSVTEIGTAAFHGCINLVNISVPNQVEKMGDRVFQACIHLTDVELPETIQSIGKGMFQACDKLETVNLPNNLTEIPENMFLGCKDLQEIEIPDGVTVIKQNAFEFCESLTTVRIPGSVTSIETRAFSACKNLESIFLPISIESIDATAFRQIYIFEIRYEGTEEQWKAIEQQAYSTFDNAYIHYNQMIYSDIKLIIGSDKLYKGSEAVTLDVPAQIIGDRTMVPLRAIFEALGAEVTWDSDTRTVTSAKGDITIKLTIDSDTLYKNDEAITLDVPGQITNDRTLVPVRAISESFGCKVEWEPVTQLVTIIVPVN